MNNQNIESIIKKHGKRQNPDDFMRHKAMKNVQEHWKKSIAIRNKTRRMRIIGMAATLFLLLSGLIITTAYYQQDSAVYFTDSVYAKGQLLTSEDGINWSLNDQSKIKNRGWIRTNNESLASLNLTDNSQIRMNQNSTIEIINSSKIILHSGEIYHDADNTTAANHLVIDTVFGSIQHIGTRYSIKVQPKNLTVAVRNGLVNVNNLKLQSGEKLKVNESGSQNISKIYASDSAWDWTTIAAIPFEAEGKSLHDFVIWYAHEYGYTINWNRLEYKTQKVQLSGHLPQLNKTLQLNTVFLSTKYDYKIKQGILSIL